MKIIFDAVISILFAAIFLIAIVLGFNFLHCTPLSILPKLTLTPVVEKIEPGSKIIYSKNNVHIIPPNKLGQPPAKAKDIWHPIELKPWTDKDGVLHVPQSGFCLVPLIGVNYNLKNELYWEIGARIFVAGQFGFEPSGNDRSWSPKLDLRPFDSNILISVGPDFRGLSFDLSGASISLKFDPGLWL